MDDAKRKVLGRWKALENSNGPPLAKRVVWVLDVAGITLCGFVAYAIYKQLNPIAIAAAAIIAGWVFAEVNALRTRIAQCPIFREYLRWDQIDADLERGAIEGQPPSQ